MINFYLSRSVEALTQLSQWVREGKLQMQEHVESGIENTFSTFLGLFGGSNKGKMLLMINE